MIKAAFGYPVLFLGLGILYLGFAFIFAAQFILTIAVPLIRPSDIERFYLQAFLEDDTPGTR